MYKYNKTYTDYAKNYKRQAEEMLSEVRCPTKHVNLKGYGITGRHES